MGGVGATNLVIMRPSCAVSLPCRQSRLQRINKAAILLQNEKLPGLTDSSFEPCQQSVRSQKVTRSTYAYLVGGCAGSCTCNPSGRCWNVGFASLPNSDTLC